MLNFRPFAGTLVAALIALPLFGQSEETAPAPPGRDIPKAPAVTEETQVVRSVAVPIVAPRYISFQGYLEENNAPANGLYDFVFRLRDFPTAGLTKWTEVQNDVQVTNGIYNVLLGSAASLASVDFNDELWLMIEVNGGNEILPRPQIVASPYSLMSLEALDLRLPAEISGTANVDGTKLLTITNEGTGDVLEIDGNDTSSDGIEVANVGLNGIEVLFPGSNGVVASGTGGIGFWASGPGSDGLLVQNAGDDGVDITNAADNGIHVDGTGDFAFLFQDLPDEINGNFLAAYVGVVENTGNSTSEDVLAIKTGSGGNPSTAANLIGFFDNENDLIGQIEGNGAGGVAYTTSGSDYAEYLPHLDFGAQFEGGDVVGVFDGRVSHRTTGAQQIMAVTDRAAVLGNAPMGSEDVTGYETVSFIGQVPVRVSGPVRLGDYIVASGSGDGTAVAISPDEIALEHVELLVGKAWESSDSISTKKINTVVGLDHTEVLTGIIARQLDEMDRQAKAIEELRILLEQHMRQHLGS